MSCLFPWAALQETSRQPVLDGHTQSMSGMYTAKDQKHVRIQMFVERHLSLLSIFISEESFNLV